MAGVGLLKRVAEALMITVLVILSMGFLTAAAEGVHLSRHFLSYALHRTGQYLRFSVDIFKNQKGWVEVIHEGNSVMYIPHPSPHQIFHMLVGTSPQMAILNTLFLLSVTMVLVFTVGGYWGLKAGYQGGRWDGVLAVLAPMFSAIPGWFWGIFLMWALWWKLSIVPLSYIDYVHMVEGTGKPTPFTYLYALTIPTLTLTFANVAVYAYNVRNLVRNELHEEYFLADVLKGLPDKRIMRKALRTVLPPFLTFTSYNFLNLMMNGMAVEVMFNVPGIG
ncbi:ABC transporter permease [Thermococcus sp.]|uniref:ABC transporter permease subunit n=1 Tax=Thermococcus sp. TaxID=35749 RepID=UPI002616803E|nr:ABC transporter permease [Thermococcus sp.]